MRLSGDAADNPDQRIADDIAVFVDQSPAPLCRVEPGLRGSELNLAQ
jgi:ABC-type uncharacterized transport system fused permease/ATPase subunit